MEERFKEPKGLIQKIKRFLFGQTRKTDYGEAWRP